MSAAIWVFYSQGPRSSCWSETVMCILKEVHGRTADLKEAGGGQHGNIKLLINLHNECLAKHTQGRKVPGYIDQMSLKYLQWRTEKYNQNTALGDSCLIYCVFSLGSTSTYILIQLKHLAPDQWWIHKMYKCYPFFLLVVALALATLFVQFCVIHYTFKHFDM